MAKLTATTRKKLPTSIFALSGRRYPIDTAARARSALSYGKRYATPSELKTIKRKVRSKYPKMKVS